MERDGGRMGTRGRDEMARLKVRECALDGASGEASGRGNGLMRCADGPAGMLGGAAIEVKVNHERSRAAVMADQVGQKAVEQVRVERYLCHALL